MLYRKNNEWHLCTHRVIYTQHEQQQETYTYDLTWWERFVALWSHTTINAIEELVFTEEQIIRYEQIKHLPEDFDDVYSIYVMHGEIPVDTNIPPTHPFKIVLLTQENALLTTSVIEMSFLAAMQQQEIAEQNSAIMEISQLVALSTGGDI